MKKSTFREEREQHLRDFDGLSTPSVIHSRLEQAVEDEEAGVEWDPEEPERPRRVRFDDVDGTYLVAEFGASGKDFWAHLDFEGDWNIGLEARRAIAKEVLAAYNREREEEAFDAEHGAEFSAAVEEVCKGEVDALVAEKVQAERDRCERLVFLLKCHYSVDDAIDGTSVRGLIEQFRLAVEQGTTHEQDLPPFPPEARSEESEGALHRLAREAGVPDDGPAEIVGAVLEELRRLRCYEALSDRAVALARGSRTFGRVMERTLTGKESRMDRWELLNPLVLGCDADCDGEVFAETFLTDHGRNLREGTLDYSPVSEVNLLVEEVPAMVEACSSCMGLLPETEDAPPEHAASAEEAFEGKGAKE